MTRPRILIVGGSTRAAADSVRRAGWDPVCADLFADLDLRKTAEVVPVRDYPHSLPDDLKKIRADGWFYCGALENHPDLIRRLIRTGTNFGPLLGTSPDALHRVRDPEWLSQVLTKAGIPVLEIRIQSAPPPIDGGWLQKPVGGAGGRQIRIWDQAAFSSPLRETHYFQRRVDGIGLSSSLQIENGRVRWLGASMELKSPPGSLAPTAFAYCGSVGPLSTLLSANDEFASRFLHDFDYDEFRERSELIAALLVQSVDGLQGLIGFDFRFDEGQLWLVEVNPRYTASIEVLELATNQSFFNSKVDSEFPKEDFGQRLIAKQILYASTWVKVPDFGASWIGQDPWKLPQVADIPIPHSTIEPGWPICTVLADGPTWASVESSLSVSIAELRKKLLDFENDPGRAIAQ